MFKSLHKSEEISLSIEISPDFTGILRGFAHDESEGCTLNGELLMTTTRRVKIKRLETVFSGVCRVNFKTTNKMGVPTSDGIESRGIYRKKKTHLNEAAAADVDSNPTTFEPGTYKFSFSFKIPPSLPHSFKGKHGSIEYELDAYATRSIFSTDVHISKPVTLRRCLMNTPSPFARNTQTVLGKKHPDIVKYSATAPSMVYCEGGLLELELNIELKDPDRYSVRIVTCGLKERVVYRTTGKSSLTNQAMHYNESSFPLGCSTFFPSQHPEYNPADLHNYTAIFRLYPRVHTDNKSSLIVVHHVLMIRMIIDDNEVIARAKIHRHRSTDSTTSVASILSHLSVKQQHDHRNSPGKPPTMTPVASTSTPPLSRSPSISELSVETMSGESILSASPPSSSSLDMEAMQPFQSNIVRVSSRKLASASSSNAAENNTIVDQGDNEEEEEEEEREGVTRDTPPGSGPRHHLGHSLTIHHHFNPFQFHKGILEEGSYECTLNMPIIVTSREEYREGGVPALPDYETAVDEPPSYRAALQCLPPVPIYPSMEELENSNNSSSSEMFTSE
ncbi:hypothetical protein V8B55DRAFT_1514170 [Mucor lusitanicus]|uniref:Arrestin-like N-terminal domain-containing protein n=2 Tax=Mucor circinelloides f. lusitanicus TaxID=29924 RepID=A0A168KTD0_MUCCL|nr:hypothetical protein FB192DRAFT_1401085 [Mucor lusitanicus]OAD02741.1 hypothetical protein MUCCIDRAFT_73332 [Mucor lusitanicus CBS 277.49]